MMIIPKVIHIDLAHIFDFFSDGHDFSGTHGITMIRGRGVIWDYVILSASLKAISPQGTVGRKTIFTLGADTCVYCLKFSGSIQSAFLKLLKF